MFPSPFGTGSGGAAVTLDRLLSDESAAEMP
jgi:hypothetical protein